MQIKTVEIFMSGCVLFAVAGSVSATCQELAQCYLDLGSTFPTGQDYSTIINFFCQKRDHLLNCYDKIKGCSTYNTYLSLYPSKAEATERMAILCFHKSEYTKAVKCIIDTPRSMSQADLQKSVTCAQNLLQSVTIETLSRSCTLIDQLIKCSPMMKKTLTCTAELMVIMYDNGISIPCMNIYRSLSSGSRLGACSFILLTGLLTGFITKRM